MMKVMSATFVVEDERDEQYVQEILNEAAEVGGLALLSFENVREATDDERELAVALEIDLEF